MSNPFDQFANELSSALPQTAAPVDDNPFSFAPPTPAPVDKPVMNSVMNSPPLNMSNGYGGGGGGAGGFEQPPMYGAPPQMYGGMGMPPTMNGGMGVMGGAPPPAGGQFSSFGAPAPEPGSNPYGAPPPSDTYTSYGAPQQAPPTPNPYGGPQGPPPPQAPPMAPPTPNHYGSQLALVPAGPPSSDPFASYGAPPSDPYGAPPQQTLNAYGSQPPAPPLQGAPPSAYGVPTSDPYGGYGAPPPTGPPANGQYGGYGAPPTAGPPGNDQFGGYGAPPPPGPPANDPYSGYGAPPTTGPPSNDTFGGYGGPPQQGPPSNDTFGGYGGPPQQGPPSSDTYGGFGGPPQQGLPSNDTFGGYGAPPQQGPPASDPFGGYGAPPQQGPPTSDPFGGYGAPPQQGPPAGDPFGGYGPPAQQQISYGAPPPYGGLEGALVISQQQSNPYGLPPQHMPPQQAAVDPFSVFNQAPAPPPAPPQVYSQALVPAQAPQQGPPPTDTGDLWGDLGFDAPPATQAVVPVSREVPEEEKKDNGDLPSGGEFYDARIFTPTLGVMFFKPQELTDSLFLNADRDLVDSLGERPVVAFIVEGSSARSAGVELGHVLLKVNGVDVRNPKEASRLIKEGPRPLPLLFYVPGTEVVVAEGEHMVKYDTRETTAPNSAKDWKPKYVVIGGIIAQPWMINMYRSKSEYDIAVIETQARRPVSVKVKQFSLQGARIQNDWQGPQMVKYKNKLHPWKYIVVLPVARNPIKISSPNLASLKPVHEGIRRVLLAQQRGRGGNQHTAAPVRDDGYRPSEPTYAQPQPQHSYGGY